MVGKTRKKQKQQRLKAERAKAKPHKKAPVKSKPRPAKHRVKVDRFDHSVSLPAVPVPQTIVDDILDKKELLASEELTRHIVLRYLRKQPAVIASLGDPNFLKTAAYEKLKKWVRQELRVLVGMFVVEHDMKKLLDAPTAKVLSSHRSTAERQEHYAQLYEELFAGVYPQVILDLAAGLNPCSYEYLGCKPVYYAIDVSPHLMDFVNEWFKRKAIVGHAQAADITQLKTLPDADTVFIFKGMDVLERVKYGHGETLLDHLGKRRIIVSFATATISGTRDISVKKRTWVERWAQANNRTIRVHQIPNEIFYIIE